ncbi:MAG: YraN family protein [Peptococcaceae bacterium]|nr:YraN family protein [Peptococcaceae bacterium]
MVALRKRQGKSAEDLAVQFLRKRGLTILQRNYRCRIGEIDIIALDGDTLVFVEVRSRSSSRFGFPQDTVNFRKQQKCKRVAECYLVSRQKTASFCRFDVIGVLFDDNGRLQKIEHIMDAF